ncbi:cyanophycin synthetase [Massilia pseudoviolaceinigra]|uniref:cyanophycin synthetase n=1 Tax=Massilia pseudoviolaceinigra TaxID=3057165 RepID=UPI00279697DB|nr:cyanophycin synthetase [Massilia sp. CCM 9206]MDQ1924818.1 cyanophycin synthetase [Massilia sp. CCM 9206]
MMTILRQRFLRGPNLFADTPCMLTLVDLGPLANVVPAAIAGLHERLTALLPSLRDYRDPADGDLGDLLEHLTLELQSLAGSEVGSLERRDVRKGQGQCRVVCSYQFERVATQAFDLALRVVDALINRTIVDVEAGLAELKDTVADCAIGTSTGAVLAAARRRGIPLIRLTDSANLFQLGWGSRQKRLQATVTGRTNYIAVDIASDKQLTKTLLEQAGLPVPEGGTVRSADDAVRMASRIEGPVTVKPLDANQGKGVTTRCCNDEEVRTAFAHAREHARTVIVERFLKGRDYRVLVTGNKVAAASWRRPPHVTGDGMSTIRQLVAVENSSPARGEGHTNILTRIPLDDIALEVLHKQGMDADSVAPAGTVVELRGNANLSTGGTAEDVTDLLPRSTVQICIRAAKTIGLDVAGIDIVCEDIAKPLAAQGGGIIEVNAAPGIRMHQYPSAGTPRDAGDAIVESMFAGSDGRIPLIAVTGTNGKTTTTRLIEHAARKTGLTTGMTTTEGVYINGELTMEGDCTGYHSALSLLNAPDVDLAVLETARGGILKRGLAFDRCDISVVLNVSADHLGLDGVDTLEELAKVKEVVARAASRAVVLNAHDPFCVDMASRLAPGVEILYFSLDDSHPVLRKHLAGGGRAVYLHQRSVVLANGGEEQRLMDERAMPVSMNGVARYNVANALAAAAALVAAGFDNNTIVAGLSSFVSDGKNNPLRSNVFDIGGVQVVVDFAHNCAAYGALSEMARGMAAGQIVGVVSAPGDRRDQDLRDIGQVCAAGFDTVVVYESESRGRPEGETARLISEGALSASPEPGRLHCKLDAHEAIRFALRMCSPGDMLIFGCGSSLSELIEAIRPDMPLLAEKITADIA